MNGSNNVRAATPGGYHPRALGTLLRIGDADAIARVVRVLEACEGNMSEASRRLSVSRSTIVQWLNPSDDRNIPELSAWAARKRLASAEQHLATALGRKKV